MPILIIIIIVIVVIIIIINAYSDYHRHHHYHHSRSLLRSELADSLENTGVTDQHSLFTVLPETSLFGMY
jgi:Tfp pilus assembly protein PilE